MKSLTQFCLLLLLAGAAALKAQNSNNLIVFSESGDRFYLILNGLKYNKTPETNVKVTGLNATHYKAKIIFEKPAADVDGTVHLMWEGIAVTNKEFSYEIVRKGDHHKLKFVSQADMGGATTANTVVYNADGSAGGNVISTAMTSSAAGSSATTSDPNSVAVSTNVGSGGYNSSTTVTTTTTAPTGAQGGSLGINMNVDGMNMSVNVNGGGPSNGMNTTGSTTITTTTTSYSSTTSSYGNTSAVQNTSINNYNETGASNATCSYAMSDATFDQLVSSINANHLKTRA